jgi:phosphonate transport system ATP-binding protein
VGEVRRRQQGRHQGKVDVFYTTPAYYDYNWSVHADMPADLRAKLKALAGAGPGHAEGKEILKLQRATRFIPRRPRTTRASKPPRAAPGCCECRAQGLTIEPDGLAPATRRRARDAAPALQCVSLRMAAGEQVAVIGPSGAGKTTLLQALACALPPTRARCTLDGRTPGQLPRARACSACAGGCSWRRRCRRCRRASGWSRGAGRPAAGDGPVGQPALAVLPGDIPAATRRWNASTWPTSSSSASTACPAASASVWAWRARCWRRPAVADRRTAVGAGPHARAPGLARLVQQARAQGATLVATLHQVDMALAHFPRIVGLRDGRWPSTCRPPRSRATAWPAVCAARARTAGDPGRTTTAAPQPAVMHCRCARW